MDVGQYNTVVELARKPRLIAMQCVPGLATNATRRLRAANAYKCSVDSAETARDEELKTANTIVHDTAYHCTARIGMRRRHGSERDNTYLESTTEYEFHNNLTAK